MPTPPASAAGGGGDDLAAFEDTAAGNAEGQGRIQRGREVSLTSRLAVKKARIFTRVAHRFQGLGRDRTTGSGDNLTQMHSNGSSDEDGRLGAPLLRSQSEQARGPQQGRRFVTGGGGSSSAGGPGGGGRHFLRMHSGGDADHLPAPSPALAALSKTALSMSYDAVAPAIGAAASAAAAVVANGGGSIISGGASSGSSSGTYSSVAGGSVGSRVRSQTSGSGGGRSTPPSPAPRAPIRGGETPRAHTPVDLPGMSRNGGSSSPPLMTLPALGKGSPDWQSAPPRAPSPGSAFARPQLAERAVTVPGTALELGREAENATATAPGLRFTPSFGSLLGPPPLVPPPLVVPEARRGSNGASAGSATGRLFQRPEEIVKYGDVVRLWSRSKYLEEGSRSPQGEGGEGADGSAAAGAAGTPGIKRSRSSRMMFKPSGGSGKNAMSSGGGSGRSFSSSAGGGGGGSSGDGGYVGLYRKVSRRRTLLGRGDLVVVGPLGDADGEFIESSLQVLDPHGEKQAGQAVRLGDVVVLCYNLGPHHGAPSGVNGAASGSGSGSGSGTGGGNTPGMPMLAWNVDTHGYTGYVDMKPRGRKGELFVTFRQPGEKQGASSWGPPVGPPHSAVSMAATAAANAEADIGMPLRYGEAGVVLMVANTHLHSQKYANQALTAFKKSTSSTAGGYVCCDGRGHTLRFAVHRARPVVRDVLIRTWFAAAPDGRSISFGGNSVRGKGGGGGSGAVTPLAEQTHHNLPWDNVVSFQMPEAQVASADLPRVAQEPVVILSLTNGCRATLYLRDILNLPERDFWVAATGGIERGRLLLHLTTTKSPPQGAAEGLAAGAAAKLGGAGGQIAFEAMRRPFVAAAAAAALAVAASAAAAALSVPLPWWLCAAAALLLCAAASWLSGGLQPPPTPRTAAAAAAAAAKGAAPIGSLEVAIVPLKWEQLPDEPEEEEKADGGEAESAAAGEGDFIDDPSTGLPPMPLRFLLAELGDYKKAQARWQQTLSWREQQRVDGILEEPQELFDIIRKYYFHCFHLTDRAGNLCYYERPGLMNWEALRSHGVQKEELVRHYIFVMEYLWNRLRPRETAKLTVVLDLEGVRLRDLAGEAVAFLKTTVGMMSAHYPQRSYKIFILNTPAFFSTMFGMVKPMLAEHTKQKINVLGPAAASRGLLEAIDAAHLPPDYGGACEVPLRDSKFERQMREHVTSVLKKAGREMRA